MPKHHVPFAGLPLTERVASLRMAIETKTGVTGKPLAASTVEQYKADLDWLYRKGRWSDRGRGK